MNKRLTAIALITFTLWTATTTMIEVPKEYYSKDKKDMNPSQLADYKVRSEYWYYLRNADILYATHLDSNKSQIHFGIYRNLIGTFFTIVSIKLNTQDAQINTFIRLGSGYTSLATPEDPIKIKPFFIQFKLDKE